MKVWVDGNPWKIAIVTENGRSLVHALLKEHTNNESEYIAVIAALNEELGDLEIISDSQLVINQLNCLWKIKEERLRELAVKVWRLAEGRQVIFSWRKGDNPAGRILG